MLVTYKDQINSVKEILLKEQLLNPSRVENEVNWFYGFIFD